MSWKTHMLSKIMIWQDFFECFWIWVVGIHVDVKISSDQAGVWEGADQRKKILKISKEILDGLVRSVVETDKVKFSIKQMKKHVKRLPDTESSIQVCETGQIKC